MGSHSKAGPRTYAGIDPGLKGWYVELEGDGEVLVAFQVPTVEGDHKVYDIKELYERLAGHVGKPSLCVVEKQQVFPRQSATSGFTIGYGMALWEVILTALKVPYQGVAPKMWRKALGLPTVSPVKRKKGDPPESKKDKERRLRVAKKKRKAAAIRLAESLFPGMDFHPNGCKEPDDNLADALLLATYARRTHRGSP